MNILKWILATPSDWFIIVLAMQFLDVGFGFAKAYKNDKVSSRKMKFGILTKALVVGAFFVFCFVAYRFSHGSVPYVACFLGLYICLMELWSIAENAISAGIPLPKCIVKLIDKESKERADAVFDVILSVFNFKKEKEDKDK